MSTAPSSDFDGQASVFATREGPCYRCLYPEPPPPGLAPNCAEGGVLGILPGLVGVIQATEVIKLILGKGEPLIGRLLLVDALAMRFRELKLRKNPECPVCGQNPTVTRLIDYQQFCGIVPEIQQQRAVKNGIPQIGVKELKQRLDAGEDLFILDVRQPYEYQIANFGGKLIPMNEVPKRLAEIDRNREIVVHCKIGRSLASASPNFSRSQATPTSRTLPGESSPGPTRSTPKCRSISVSKCGRAAPNMRLNHPGLDSQ